MKSWTDCECSKPVDWNSRKNGDMWNPSTCDSECHKTSKIGEYLHTKNCICKARVIDNLLLTSKDEISIQ